MTQAGWASGRLVESVPNAETVTVHTRGKLQLQVRILWMFPGIQDIRHFEAAGAWLVGQGSEVYGFEPVTMKLKLHLQATFGFQKFLSHPRKDRVIVLGLRGLCVLDERLATTWRLEGLPTREALSFDAFTEKGFRLKGRDRPADEWEVMEFDLDVGQVAGRGGPGATPTSSQGA
jgi:hypothetical protein